MNTWHLAHLTPQADEIFTDAFYPPVARGTKSRSIYFTQLPDSQHRVVLASRADRSGIRVVSQELARVVMGASDNTKRDYI